MTEAVAVELVHDFLLLHDDIIDGDPTRRHRAAAWWVFGVGRAIIAGDTLLSLASHVLAERPGLRVLTTAQLDLCAGQSADMAFEQRADVGVAECVAMAECKTAALLACACELGALAGGGDARQCRLLAELGRRLGLAFQLADDLLGIWGDPAVTGKPRSSDLANRKKSLPVVAALTSGTVSGDHLALLQRDELFATELGHRREVRRYVTGLEHLMAGSLRWSYITGRYHGKDHAWNGKIGGTVTLLPDRTLLPTPDPRSPVCIGDAVDR